MLTIFDSSHIPTNRCVTGHRGCRTHTGFFSGAGESRRIRYEIIALVNRRFRFAWLIGQWKSHEEAVKNRSASCRG
jgi:plasmid replication initiation protein